MKTGISEQTALKLVHSTKDLVGVGAAEAQSVTDVTVTLDTLASSDTLSAGLADDYTLNDLTSPVVTVDEGSAGLVEGAVILRFVVRSQDVLRGGVAELNPLTAGAEPLAIGVAESTTALVRPGLETGESVAVGIAEDAGRSQTEYDETEWLHAIGLTETARVSLLDRWSDTVGVGVRDETARLFLPWVVADALKIGVLESSAFVRTIRQSADTLVAGLLDGWRLRGMASRADVAPVRLTEAPRVGWTGTATDRLTAGLSETESARLVSAAQEALGISVAEAQTLVALVKTADLGRMGLAEALAALRATITTADVLGIKLSDLASLTNLTAAVTNVTTRDTLAAGFAELSGVVSAAVMVRDETGIALDDAIRLIGLVMRDALALGMADVPSASPVSAYYIGRVIVARLLAAFATHTLTSHVGTYTLTFATAA